MFEERGREGGREGGVVVGEGEVEGKQVGYVPRLEEGAKLLQFHSSFENVGKTEGVGESLLARRAVYVFGRREGGRREGQV